MNIRMFFSLLLFAFSQAKSQAIVSESSELNINGYKLIYGNIYLENIYLLEDNTKLIMLKKPNGADFHLLGSNNLSQSSLFIKSAPANILLSYNNYVFSYQSMFLYKSELCNCCDYKAGEVHFAIENKTIKFVNCSQIDNHYIRDAYFEKVGNAKLTVLEKVKDKSNATSIQSGFAIDDVFLVKRKITSPKTEYFTLYPHVVTRNGLLVFDILGNSLLNISLSEKSINKTIPFSYPFQDSVSTFDRAQLIYDHARDKSYILFFRRIINKSDANANKDRQIFYELRNKELIDRSSYLPQITKGMQIADGKIFALFRKNDDEKGSTFLYESLTKLPE